MPSLPELEVYKEQLAPELIGHPVADVEGLDYRVVRVDIEILKTKLVHKALLNIKRYGKWLIFDFGEPEQVIMHLGLTGNLKLTGPDDKMPRFSCFSISFEGGQRLIMADQRKLGRLYLRNFDELKKEKNLGQDLLDMDDKDFVQAVVGKRRAVRDVLMDQKLVAGIGGKYADEILWQAELHPSSKVDHLSDEEVHELFRLAQSINREAIARGADVDKLPEDWLIPHRHTDKRCPRCGSPLTERKLGGSESFYCPVDQSAPNPSRSG